MIIFARSKLSISNIFRHLSYGDTLIRFSLVGLSDMLVIVPTWALKCLTNSMLRNTFFQNLMWPSLEAVIMKSFILDTRTKEYNEDTLGYGVTVHKTLFVAFGGWQLFYYYVFLHHLFYKKLPFGMLITLGPID